jgi:hypothetical protein
MDGWMDGYMDGYMDGMYISDHDLLSSLTPK